METTQDKILVIGDLHAPAIKDGYLEFCKGLKKKYKCNRIIQIGDEVDWHASSYHEADPDLQGAGDELTAAIKQLKPWYKAFPVMELINGNHTLIVKRKIFSAKLSSRVMRDYGDIIEAPKTWTWTDRLEIDSPTGPIQFVHGGPVATTKARNDMMSTVSGHFHAKCYVQWTVGRRFKYFACQTGAGVDDDHLCMAYGKSFAKSAIGAVVILDGVPTNHMMNL